MQKLAENLWIERYPLNVLGSHHGRVTTILRLASGRLIIHSMGPFTPADVAAIRALGEPGWLVEAILLHDTFARQGHDAFPGVPFLGPPGFGGVVKFPTLPLLPAPPEWAGEVDVIEIGGIPRLKEYAFIHRPSRTAIVADLVFNFRTDERGWNRFFHRRIAGFKRYPAMSRPYRLMISDRKAFRASLERVLAADFDRLIVGHREVVASGGQALLRRALTDAKVL